MDLVVDASVLVAELLRASGRARLAQPGVTLFLAEQTWGEVQHELPRRARRLAVHTALTAEATRALIDACLAAVQANVMIVPAEAYAPLEQEARWRVARDHDDWPVVALALALGAAIWTEDGDFLGCGVATWTTRTLSLFLSHSGGAADAAPDP